MNQAASTGYLNASAGNMPAMKQRAAYVGQLSCRCVAVSGVAVSHPGHDLAGYGCPSNLICHQSVKASWEKAVPACKATHAHGSEGLSSGGLLAIAAGEITS